MGIASGPEGRTLAEIRGDDLFQNNNIIIKELNEMRTMKSLWMTGFKDAQQPDNFNSGTDGETINPPSPLASE